MAHSISGRLIRMTDNKDSERLCDRCGRRLKVSGRPLPADGLVLCRDCRCDREYVRMAGRTVTT